MPQIHSILMTIFQHNKTGQQLTTKLWCAVTSTSVPEGTQNIHTFMRYITYH